jgi:hypothetical protein
MFVKLNPPEDASPASLVNPKSFPIEETILVNEPSPFSSQTSPKVILKKLLYK